MLHLPWLKSCRPVDEDSIEFKYEHEKIELKSARIEIELLKNKKSSFESFLETEIDSLKKDLVFERSMKAALKNIPPEYVPVPPGHKKPYNERWADKEYLEIVTKFSQNKTLQSEIMNTVYLIREDADNATSTDELKGINKVLRHAKSLLTMSQRASDVLKTMVAVTAVESESGADYGA